MYSLNNGMIAHTSIIKVNDMPEAQLLSIIESPSHPHFSQLYAKLGLVETKLRTIRSANIKLKQLQPQIVVAQFFYGYSNNYSGVHISNLDVLLVSLKKYAETAKLIVFVDRKEQQYIEKLPDVFPLTAVLPLPVSNSTMERVLTDVLSSD